MEGTLKIFIENAQTGQELYFPNAQGVNLPAVSPTVEDMNRILSQQNGANVSAEQRIQEGEPPVLGSHVKEAIEIVRDWVKNGSK